MNKLNQLFKVLSLLTLSLISKLALAGSPVFTMIPQTPVVLQLASGETAIVKYLVTNQSLKPHTITMKPIAGVIQLTDSGSCPNPFTLTARQSCILSLQITASQISGKINEGPIICQIAPDGNPSPLLCNQPSPANSLNISVQAANQYTVNISAGSGGSVFPSGTQAVNCGSSLPLYANPAPGFSVYQWLVDGSVVQMGGSNFTLTNITANHQVSVSFTSNPVFFGGAQNGNVYYSFSGGLSWSATVQMPGAGSPVNSLWINPLVMYSGNANGFIYYSLNNGNSWQQTTSPDGSAINAVFVLNNQLYAGTASGFIYYSLNNGSSWNLLSSPDGSAVNALFLTNSAFYAGTSNGNVYYSSNNGVSWTAINGLVDGSPVVGVYVANNSLFANTANEYVYSSNALMGGGNWGSIAQTVFSLFVNSSGLLFAGTQGGYVYSVSEGLDLGFITYSPMNAVVVLN
ncbi:InlB B-repeat-containing protein [Legionella quinlivanii]|uniref:InlB B-repeat-containing protein n=1 Tax=Legionella quinlivanii TaxID=45073 RepID=UPI002243D562|nr:hypothetical protein [Legionella quinlivanii]MCW8449793.1 hypothetical protein [Legionella quinlivanii]